MMAVGLLPDRTFAVHPTSRGFGWVAFEGPLVLFEANLVFARRRKNETCLAKIEELFDRLRPQTLVMESFGQRTSNRLDRIARLCHEIVDVAGARGIEVAIYTRDEIKACFREVGAETRDEVAMAIARHVDALSHRLPNQRKVWESEDRRLALFSAAALAITHFRIELGLLFDDLKSAA